MPRQSAAQDLVEAGFDSSLQLSQISSRLMEGIVVAFSAQEIAALSSLIDRLRTSAQIDWHQAEMMRNAHLFDWSVADTSPAVLERHHDRYRLRAFDIRPTHGEFYGKRADQDLGWNVLFLGRLLDDWFANAHTIPPHWPERICVLLRKAKEFALERDFLSAFIPHYMTSVTAPENCALLARAIKIGAYP